jgi:ammonium transporter, Amt family
MVLDSGATAWVLAATCLVMLMTPGVGLFYGGLVRKKNVINIIALSFLAYAIVSIQWVLCGYSLAFGTDVSGIIGGLNYVGLAGVGMDGKVIPDILFAAFQLVFAGLTLAIIISGVAERIKLTAFVVFGLLWTTLVYDVLAHWAWGGGWAAQLGALDFAGGTVVHISAGFGALAIAFVIGKRAGFKKVNMIPHNISMTLLGAALLWFGWFGFNAGSALAANGIASNALMVTNTAAAAGAITWLVASSVHGKPSAVGMVSGAIAGLVAITPAAGYVDVWSSLIIGIVAGFLCYRCLLWRLEKGLDESLDAWAIHGMGGLWGAIATGIFCSPLVTGGALSGLIYGNVNQFLVNTGDAIVAVIFAFCATYILAKIVDTVIGLRVTEDEEYLGLDIAVHGERA